MSRTQSHADRAAPAASADALRRFATEVFARTGMPEADAAVVADVLVWANLRGVDTHGVARIPRYVDLIEGGDMNPRPAIAIRTVNESESKELNQTLTPITRLVNRSKRYRISTSSGPVPTGPVPRACNATTGFGVYKS